MKLPSKSIQDKLPSLLKRVKSSRNYFKDNYQRFNMFRSFVYEKSITQPEQDVNNELGRPNLETNVLTAYQSRLCGEFSKQEPSFEVSKEEGADIPNQVPEMVEGHLRHIMEEAKSANTQYSTYRNSLSGGFTSFKVFTEFAHEKSFEHVLKFRQVKYPTMVGHDPLAREPHKCDGEYQFECYPMTKDDFLEKWKIDLSQVIYPPSSSIEGFTWSFNDGDNDMLLVCDFYEKKRKKVEILLLANNKSYTQKEYEEFLKKWEEEMNLAPPPVIVKKRISTFYTICRYTFMEKMVLEYVETDFKYLPLPFVDGDSIDLFDDSRGSLRQFTRPYCYNAKGAQQLKNLGVQCLAHYLEMMAQHKYIIKKEAIPQEKSYLDALTRVQKASTLVVNAFKDNNPDHAIPDPIIPVQPQAAPPEISNSIGMADQIIQAELGSYDAALGINNNELSGLAIVEAATQSNAAAMPFVVNYIQALNQVALILVDLMPKYYKFPTTIPIIDREGNRSAVRINDKNDPNSVDFNYDSNLLQVEVTAGVNFAIQKSKALNQIIAMCKAAPGFADFMQKKGLKVLLDNFEIRGIDILKSLADEYEQEMKQAAAQQSQMQQQMMQNNPHMINAQSKQFDTQVNAQVKSQELQFKREELDMKKEVAIAERDASIARAHAEETRAMVDVKLAHLDMEHQHGKDIVELAHKVNESDRNHERLERDRKNASKEIQE
jgi:hypothetical protein